MDNNMFSYVFVIMEGIAAIYFLYTAISGKGSAFDLEYVKDGKEEEFVKKTRIWYGIMGVLAILLTVFNLLVDCLGYDHLRWVLIGVLITIALAALAGYFWTRSCFSKNRREF